MSMNKNIVAIVFASIIATMSYFLIFSPMTRIFPDWIPILGHIDNALGGIIMTLIVAIWILVFFVVKISIKR